MIINTNYINKTYKVIKLSSFNKKIYNFFSNKINNSINNLKT